MQKELTGDDLYALLMLMRNSDARAFLVLEGETDVTALSGHINDAECQPISGYGKQAVIKAMLIAEEQGIEAVAALVDRDWAGFLADDPGIDNVFYTDGFDLESTIMAIKPLRDRVINNFTDTRRSCSYKERVKVADVMDVVVSAAIVVSAVRYMCEKKLINGSARDFPIDVVLDLDGGGADLSRTLELAMRRAGQSTPYADAALVDLRNILAKLPHTVDCCNGHDLARGLAQLMHKRLGASALGGDFVERAMRSAFGCLEIQGTRFFHDLLEWGRARKRDLWNCPLQRS